jgi:hypothetical protein
MNDTERRNVPDGAATPAGNDAEAARIKANIENTRAEMTATMSALESKLSPSELREQVGEAVREHLAEAKALVKEELSEAKGLLAKQVVDVEQRVRQGLREARETVMTDVQGAIDGAKRSVRAATVGRVEDLATQLGDTMNDTRDTLMDTVRQNPIPAALAGIGLVWLFMNRSSSSRSRGGRANGAYGPYSSPNHGQSALGQIGQRAGAAIQDVGSAAHRASENASWAAHRASDAVTNVAHQASDAAGNAVRQASDTVSSAFEGTSALVHRAEDAASQFAGSALASGRRAEKSVETALHDSPLAFGAAALVAGAALGFALPRTQREDAIMGQARDQIVARAEHAATDTAATVVKAAEKSATDAKKRLSEAAGAAKAAETH